MKIQGEDEHSRPPMLYLLCASKLFGAPPDACVEEYMCAKRGFWDHSPPLPPTVLRRIRIQTMAAITITMRLRTPPAIPPISAPRDIDFVEVEVVTVPPASSVGVGLDDADFDVGGADFDVNDADFAVDDDDI